MGLRSIAVTPGNKGYLDYGVEYITRSFLQLGCSRSRDLEFSIHYQLCGTIIHHIESLRSFNSQLVTVLKDASFHPF